MNHSEECMKRAREFEKKYPNYCRTCGGWGGFLVPGVRTFSNGDPGYPDEFEDCQDCVCQFKCPLCEKEFPEENMDDDILPCGHEQYPEGIPECYCWVEFL